MKTADIIWQEFKSGKITTQQAFQEIDKSIKSSSK